MLLGEDVEDILSSDSSQPAGLRDAASSDDERALLENEMASLQIQNQSEDPILASPGVSVILSCSTIITGLPDLMKFHFGAV